MAKINYSDPNCPMLEYLVGGYMYSFTVKDFPKESLHWLCECIQEDVDTIHARAVHEAKTDLQYTIKTALGIR